MKNNKRFQKEMTMVLQNIAGNLLALRVARKESLRLVAGKIRMSPATLSKIERGLHPRFRLTTFLRLCKYYQVHPKKVIIKGETIPK